MAARTGYHKRAGWDNFRVDAQHHEVHVITNEQFSDHIDVQRAHQGIIMRNNFVIKPWTELLFDDFTESEAGKQQ